MPRLVKTENFLLGCDCSEWHHNLLTGNGVFPMLNSCRVLSLKIVSREENADLSL